MTDITADRLAAVYIKIRDKRSELKRAFEQEDEELKAQQELVSEKLMDMMKAINANSLKTSKGTVSRSIKHRYTTTNWPELYDFIKKHDAFELLQQRIHETNMKAFLDENPEELPPGLNCLSSYQISVRRSKG